MIPKSSHLSFGCTDKGYDDVKGLIIGDVFSLAKQDDESIIFRDEGDGFYIIEMPKQEAIELLQELIEYIKNE